MRDLEAVLKDTPDSVPALEALADAYGELGDPVNCRRVCQRLVERRPDEPRFHLALAFACMGTGDVLEAASLFRKFLARWPQDPAARVIRHALRTMGPVLQEAEEAAVDPQQAAEFEAFRGEMERLMHRGRFEAAECLALERLSRCPTCTPALNNLSQVQALLGRLPDAVTTALRVLDLDPENHHALGNLARYCCFQGRMEEARLYAGRLKKVDSFAVDLGLKQAETFAYLGDDRGVLDAFDQTRRQRSLGAIPEDGFLCHLAAVAAMRRGDHRLAEQRWRQSLSIDPNLAIARENVDDLRRPVESRNAPWPFPLGNWLSAPSMGAIRKVLDKGRPGDLPSDALREVLRVAPELSALVPHLLDRGDPRGRKLALLIAGESDDPRLAQALRDFALSTRGPDEMRIEAASRASQAELLPAGTVRMWLRGAWQETVPLIFEIHGEPLGNLPWSVVSQMRKASELLNEGRAGEAERVLRALLERRPNTPQILNNLGGALEAQGRLEEARELLERAHSLDPEYLFPRTSLATLAARDGDLARARSLLDPLLRRRRLHFSEFRVLAQTEIKLLIAEGRLDAARSWIRIWQDILPDDALIETYAQRLGAQHRRSGVGRRAA